MKVILRHSVENLGKPGDIVRVKPGYAHNYLIPNQIALPVTEGNIKQVEQEKRRLAIRESKLKAEAEEMAKSIEGTRLFFEKKAGLEGVLYGSVTTTEIAESLEAKGIEVDRKDLILLEPIKRIGEFTVRLRLHAEVETEFRVLVKSEDGLAEKAIAEAAEAAEQPPVEEATAANAEVKAQAEETSDEKPEPEAEDSSGSEEDK
jgi:large subunit ribosomal protein L9